MYSFSFWRSWAIFFSAGEADLIEVFKIMRGVSKRDPFSLPEEHRGTFGRNRVTEGTLDRGRWCLQKRIITTD